MSGTVDLVDLTVSRFRRKWWFTHVWVAIAIVSTILGLSASLIPFFGTPAAGLPILLADAIIAISAFALYLNQTRRTSPALRVDTVKDFRENLKNLDDESLNHLAVVCGLVVPEDCDTRAKKENFITNEIPLQYVRAKSVPTRVSFLAALLVCVLITESAWLAYLRHEPSSVRHVRRFYGAINRGIQGERTAWKEMWNYFPLEKQDKYYKKVFANLRFPEDMGKLYEGSSPHNLLYVKEVGSTSYEQEVDVVYQLDEHHPINSLGFYASFQDSPKLQEFYKQFPDVVAVSNQIMSDLRPYYFFQSEKPDDSSMSEDEIKKKLIEYVGDSKLADVFYVRYLTELGARLGLKQRPKEGGGWVSRFGSRPCHHH